MSPRGRQRDGKSFIRRPASRPLPLLIGVGLLFWCLAASAGQSCDPALVRNAAKNIGESNYNVADCKAMPNDPTRTVALLEDTNGRTMLLVDSRDGHILARGDVALDAPFDTVALDTGRYYLNAATRAIGVRTHYANVHAIGNSDDERLEEGEWLYLYLVDGARIRPVLTGQQMLSNLSQDECAEPSAGADCEQRNPGYKEESTLSVANTSHNGFADLLLVTKKSCNPGGCGTREPMKTGRDTQILKYDGKSYR
jgi:hypothetical protein